MSDDLGRALAAVAEALPSGVPSDYAALRRVLALLPAPSPTSPVGGIPPVLDSASVDGPSDASGGYASASASADAGAAVAGSSSTDSASPNIVVIPTGPPPSPVPVGTLPGIAIAPNSLPGSALTPGALNDITKFASTIRPPVVVNALPALPDAAYPAGTYAYLTTEHALYKTDDGATWVKAIGAGDIQAASITAGQIAAAAIGASQIAAGAITADKLAATLLLASTIVAGSASGARLEMASDGLRAYASDGVTLMAYLPTDGVSPFYMNGTLVAQQLSSYGGSLSGNTGIPGGAQLIVADRVSAPSTAPSLSQPALASTTFAATPVPLSDGVCYDPNGYNPAGGTQPTYLVPAAANDANVLAYEFKASDGTLLRSLSLHVTSTATEVFGTAPTGSSYSKMRLTTGRAVLSGRGVGAEYDASGYSRVLPTRAGTLRIVNLRMGLSAQSAVDVSGAVFSVDAAGASSGPGTLLGSGAAVSLPADGWTDVPGGSVGTRAVDLPVAVPVRSGQLAYLGLRAGTVAGSIPVAYDFTFGGTHRECWGGAYDPEVDDAGPGSWSDGYDTGGIDYDLGVQFTLREVTCDEGVVGRIVGIAREGTHLWMLDSFGRLLCWNQSNFAFVGNYDHSARFGTYDAARSGLIWNGTHLCITRASETTPQLIKVDTAGAFVATVGLGFTPDNTGTTHLRARGGYWDGAAFWIAMNDGAKTGVFCFNAAGALTADREFGLVGEIGSGVTWDGAVFRGWGGGKLWTFTSWDWTGAVTTWVVSTWKNVASGYETTMSPIASIALGRRRKLSVTTPPIVPGADRVGIYMAQQSLAPNNTQVHLQVTDALTGRVLSSYAGGAAAPGANSFPATSPGVITDAAGLWQLKGDGSVLLPSTGLLFSGGAAQPSIGAGVTTRILLNGITRDNAAMVHAGTVEGALTGTLSSTAGSPNVTGVGTSFTTELAVGQVVIMDSLGAPNPGEMLVVQSITNNTAFVATRNATQSKANKTCARMASAMVVQAGYAGWWAFSVALGLATVATPAEVQLWIIATSDGLTFRTLGGGANMAGTGTSGNAAGGVGEGVLAVGDIVYCSMTNRTAGALTPTLLHIKAVRVGA